MGRVGRTSLRFFLQARCVAEFIMPGLWAGYRKLSNKHKHFCNDKHLELSHALYPQNATTSDFFSGIYWTLKTNSGLNSVHLRHLAVQHLQSSRPRRRWRGLILGQILLELLSSVTPCCSLKNLRYLSCPSCCWVPNRKPWIANPKPWRAANDRPVSSGVSHSSIFRGRKSLG